MTLNTLQTMRAMLALSTQERIYCLLHTSYRWQMQRLLYLQTAADLLHSLQAVYTNQAGYEREALELLKLGNYKAATNLCRTAERAARANSSSQTPLTRLQDSIALLASLKGSRDGFDGRTLEVGNCRHAKLSAAAAYGFLGSA